MSRISERVIVLFCVGIAFLILLPVSRAEGAGDNALKLLKLAKKEKKFGILNKAEKELLRCFAEGEVADRSDKSGKNNDPNEANDLDPNTGVLKWDPNNRVIRGKFIKWLCTDPNASSMVTHKGILVKGARIEGELDLSDARISFPLSFRRCAFKMGINLRDAEIRNLNLEGTYTGPICGSGLKVKGNVFLRNDFTAEGKVNLVSATIGGVLDCNDGQFINKGKVALSAYGVKVEGDVLLRKGFLAEGEVHLGSATIGGHLDCNDGRFINKGADALSADRLKVEYDVFLNNSFKAEGEVRLLCATIGGNLECDGGQFINKGADALSADGLKVEYDVFLNNSFKAEGEVRLLDATIGGNLECDGGQFINKGADALSADGLNVKGVVFLNNGFKAQGEVRLLGAIIGGQLDCEKGQFINKGADALSADVLKVEGDVFLHNGFKADGEVRLPGATITGDFVWTDVNSPEEVTLDLRYATIGTLLDDDDSWPEKGKLFMHGIVFNEIHNKAPSDAKNRIDWLRRQPDYWPQPYEQLAAVLRKGGQDEDAKRILIAKNQDKARLTKLTFTEKCWYRVFGPIIGYGYRPWRALWIGLVIVLFGWLFFWAGDSVHIMTPTKEGADVSGTISEKRNISPDYPKFCALVYSLDVFVPLVDLHQSSYWLPNANRDGELHLGKFSIPISGKAIRCYLWCEIIAGWILTSLLVVGLTGLVRT
jgi:sRNA-binding regulator protein Hfq